MKQPSIRDINYMKQISRTMDMDQIKFHLANDYPHWEKVIVKKELNMRRGLMLREN